MSALPPKPAPKPRNVKIMRAAFEYKARENDELSFNEGDVLYILNSNDPDWWRARCRGVEGLVPSNMLEDATNGGVTSPLHDAAMRGNVAMVEECLLNKIPANQPDCAGNTPLHWAARGGHDDCVRILTSVDKILLDARNRLDETPLTLAAAHGHSSVVEMLVNAGSNPGLVNRDGKSAEELAVDPQVQVLLRRLKGSQAAPGYNIEDYQGSEDED